MTAPLRAPTDVPMITSGSIARSMRARSIPTWLTPWFPPTRQHEGRARPTRSGGGHFRHACIVARERADSRFVAREKRLRRLRPRALRGPRIGGDRRPR